MGCWDWKFELVCYKNDGSGWEVYCKVVCVGKFGYFFFNGFYNVVVVGGYFNSYVKVVYG